MSSEPSEWRVPAPLRALLWWPLVAFVLAMIDPELAPATIFVAGALLAVLGGLAAALTGQRAPTASRTGGEHAQV